MNTETIELPYLCRWYLEALKEAGETDALRRVAEAGPETWGRLAAISWDGRRCLVGHAYSAEIMLAEHDEWLEAALWSALRAL